jgi:hypothetical protein
MYVERLCRRSSNSFQYHRPDGDVGHESAVHYIDVNPVGSGGIYRPYLIPKTREVGRQNRRRDDDRWRFRPRSSVIGLSYGF